MYRVVIRCITDYELDGAVLNAADIRLLQLHIEVVEEYCPSESCIISHVQIKIIQVILAYLRTNFATLHTDNASREVSYQ